MKSNNDLILRSIRLAEYTHRKRVSGPHLRKAPQGQDRPSYFVHLTEVAWMLSDACCSHETVAAGYLHDIVEDCGYTVEQLEEEIGNRCVSKLVEWVSEPDRLDENGVKLQWEIRNKNYLERIKSAPLDALNISCADKTSNIREMCSWLERGYRVDDFTSRDLETQLAKFDSLDEFFSGKVSAPIYERFMVCLGQMRGYSADPS